MGTPKWSITLAERADPSTRYGVGYHGYKVSLPTIENDCAAKADSWCTPFGIIECGMLGIYETARVYGKVISFIIYSTISMDVTYDDRAFIGPHVIDVGILSATAAISMKVQNIIYSPFVGPAPAVRCLQDSGNVTQECLWYASGICGAMAPSRVIANADSHFGELAVEGQEPLYAR